MSNDIQNPSHRPRAQRPANRRFEVCGERCKRHTPMHVLILKIDDSRLEAPTIVMVPSEIWNYVSLMPGLPLVA